MDPPTAAPTRAHRQMPQTSWLHPPIRMPTHVPPAHTPTYAHIRTHTHAYARTVSGVACACSGRLALAIRADTNNHGGRVKLNPVRRAAKMSLKSNRNWYCTDEGRRAPRFPRPIPAASDPPPHRASGCVYSVRPAVIGTGGGSTCPPNCARGSTYGSRSRDHCRSAQLPAHAPLSAAGKLEARIRPPRSAPVPL